MIQPTKSLRVPEKIEYQAGHKVVVAEVPLRQVLLFCCSATTYSFYEEQLVCASPTASACMGWHVKTGNTSMN